MSRGEYEYIQFLIVNFKRAGLYFLMNLGIERLIAILGYATVCVVALVLSL